MLAAAFLLGNYQDGSFDCGVANRSESRCCLVTVYLQNACESACSLHTMAAVLAIGSYIIAWAQNEDWETGRSVIEHLYRHSILCNSWNASTVLEQPWFGASLWERRLSVDIPITEERCGQATSENGTCSRRTGRRIDTKGSTVLILERSPTLPSAQTSQDSKEARWSNTLHRRS